MSFVACVGELIKVQFGVFFPVTMDKITSRTAGQLEKKKYLCNL